MTMPMMTPTMIWILIAITLVIGWCPPQSWAMLAPAVANEMGTDSGRIADLQVVQRALESKLVQQRLLDFGLTADEVQARLARLSDEELHQMATQIDTLMPGGELGIIILLLVIAIIVLVVVYLMGHKVVVKE
jgi:hypothetical protein